MAKRGFRQRMRASVEELDRSRLEERYQGLDVMSIAAAPLRTPIRIAGEVQSVTVVPTATSPSLEVVISDGSGKAVGVFLGRRKIAGLSPGRKVAFEGVAARDGKRLLVFNPVYELLA